MREPDSATLHRAHARWVTGEIGFSLLQKKFYTTRADTSDTISSSVFEEFRKDSGGRYIAVQAIHQLLKQTNAGHIILSYSSGGRATAVELCECIADIGRTKEILELDYKRNVMAGMQWTKEWVKEAEEPNREFMFLIEKDKKPNKTLRPTASNAPV